MIICGDSLAIMKEMSDNSVDSLVTDPPAGISFMGKAWDDDKGGRDQWIAWLTEVMREALRVMKPGAHGLVWAIPRTSHWTATALENAGFEVRDVVTHLFGSGFPKSMDISKAIDKAAGAERVVVGINPNHRKTSAGEVHSTGTMVGEPHTGDGSITAPATDDAKRWQGFGTALKPASEHWILIRKPISEKTVAKNVLKWGCGGLNIDASRIAAGDDLKPVMGGAKGKKQADFGAGTVYGNSEKYESFVSPNGRFPANLVLDEAAAEMLDAQSGVSKSPKSYTRNFEGKGVQGWGENAGKHSLNFGDSGGASRFFYVAKASKSDKGASNTHPTVKSTKLMEYLITLITAPGGTVLDPFAGSGSTGVAAVTHGFKFVGIEREKEYVQISTKRIEAVT